MILDLKPDLSFLYYSSNSFFTKIDDDDVYRLTLARPLVNSHMYLLLERSAMKVSLVQVSVPRVCV